MFLSGFDCTQNIFCDLFLLTNLMRLFQSFATKTSRSTRCEMTEKLLTQHVHDPQLAVLSAFPMREWHIEIPSLLSFQRCKRSLWIKFQINNLQQGTNIVSHVDGFSFSCSRDFSWFHFTPPLICELGINLHK